MRLTPLATWNILSGTRDGKIELSTEKTHSKIMTHVDFSAEFIIMKSDKAQVVGPEEEK